MNSSELIERLRETAKRYAEECGMVMPNGFIEWQAADALEAKDKEIEGLREALKPFAQAAEDHMEQYEIAMSVGAYVPIDDNAEICVPITFGECSRARAKLKGNES